MAAIAAACLAVAALYVLLAPRVYEASARMLVDSSAPSPIDEGGSEGEQNSRVVMSTQADIIRTPAVAAGAAQVSGLSREPAFVRAWQENSDGKTPVELWVGSQLLKSISVEPKRDTNVLLINARSSDPQLAARIANGFAQSALNTQYRLRTEPAKVYAAWLEKRLEGARLEVREAQDKLSTFAQQTGITDGDLSAEGAQMADVATQLAAAEAKAAAARQTGFTGAQSVADAERSEVVQRLRQQVAESSGKVAELESVYGPEYPEVKRTRAELATLRSQLNAESANARAAFAAARAAEAAAERAATSASESTLRSVAGEQRSRLSSMGSNLAKYSTLRNEFDAAKKSFNDINERLLKMRLQGNIPETEVKIVDVAAPPRLPSSPRVGLILLLSLLAGLILGSLAAIILESLDPRIRSRATIERLLGVRVIGQLPLTGPAAARPLLARPDL